MRRNRPLRLGRTAKLLLLTVAATAVAVSVIFMTVGRAKRTGGEAQVTSTIVKERILRINELSTVKYMYTNVGKFSQSNDFYGYEIPLTTKRFLITYDGTIKAGVDLQNADVSVTDSTVTLTLPPAKVLSHEIDESSIQVYDETKNIFNPISVKDYTDFAAKEKTQMEQKAISHGLLKEAAEKAETNLSELLTSVVGSRKVVLREQAVSSAAGTSSAGESSAQADSSGS